MKASSAAAAARDLECCQRLKPLYPPVCNSHSCLTSDTPCAADIHPFCLRFFERGGGTFSFFGLICFLPLKFVTGDQPIEEAYFPKIKEADSLKSIGGSPSEDMRRSNPPEGCQRAKVARASCSTARRNAYL